MQYLLLFESFNSDNVSFDDVMTLFIVSSSIPFDGMLCKLIEEFFYKYDFHSDHCVAISKNEISNRIVICHEFLNRVNRDISMKNDFIEIMNVVYDILKSYPDLIDILTLCDDLLEEDNVSYMFTIKDYIELSFDGVDVDPNVIGKYRPHYFEKLANRIRSLSGNKCEYEFQSRNRWNFGDVIKIYKKDENN